MMQISVRTPLLLLALHGTAVAAAPSDVSITTLGASGTWSAAVEEGEVAALFGERLRWTLTDSGTVKSRVLLDTRFVYEVFDQELRWHQVRQLGVTIEGAKWTFDLGRHPVRFGGPRIVDGVQALTRLGDHLEVGGWGGLAPDLFTTMPRIRFGGGPIVAYTASRGQVAMVGETLLDEGGNLDRAAVLATARYSVDRLLDVSGRLDLELVGEDDSPHLTDGQVMVITRPTKALRIDVFYNAFSSYRYLQTEQVDPTLQRFQARVLENGIDPGILQDFRDPTIHHLGGAGVRYEAQTDGARPRVGVNARYRLNEDPDNQLARVGPQIGVGEIPLAGRLDVALDGHYIIVNQEAQYDAGLLLMYEPGEDPAFAVDVSGRLLINPEYDKMGWYADAFVDVMLPASMVIVAGVSAINEPYEGLPDLGITGFLRVTKYVRPARGKR